MKKIIELLTQKEKLFVQYKDYDDKEIEYSLMEYIDELKHEYPQLFKQ